MLTKPMPIGQKLQIWAHETLEAIHKNFQTQEIFPEGEVYPGWFAKNQAVRGDSWHSTGAGFDSFYFHILQASEVFDVGVRDWAVDFMYNYYTLNIPLGQWKYDGVVNAIIRDKYRSDEMEAITNNMAAVNAVFLQTLVTEGLVSATKYLKDSVNEINSTQFKEMQEWRRLAKDTAREVFGGEV